jgi:hypothetical protein
MVYNGITIVPNYTGLVGDPTSIPSPINPSNGARDNLYPGSFFGCYGSNVVAQPSYSLWAGNTLPATPYTYSLNFSEPVNNIKILYNGTNADPNQEQYETFIWDTNGGTPDITLCDGCGQIIDGNIISGTFGPELYPGVTQNPQNPQYATGGGIITISAPSNYTTLTLRSPGGNQGTVFGICSGSIEVAGPPISPSLTPSPSISPSISPTPTPSLTPPVSPNVGVNTIYKYLDIL